MTAPTYDTVVLAADGPGIATAARALAGGELVAFPTETVYGLGADARSSAAVRSVFEAKQRPHTDPLIVHVAEAAQAEALGDLDSEDGVLRALVERFWPGPLTVVVPRRAGLATEVSPGDTVGLRCPAHPVALSLLRAAGVPVAAPSANRFGRVSPTEARHVVDELAGRIPWVLDGGPTPLGVESTVVAAAGGRVRVLRPGGVTVEDLAAAVGPGLVDAPDRVAVAEGQAAAGPGMTLSHYAPSVPLVLTDAGPSVAAELVGALVARGVSAEVLELPAGDAAARELYRCLRALDERGAELAVVPAVDPMGLGRAVNDRLFRAAHGHIEADASGETVARIAARLGR